MTRAIAVPSEIRVHLAHAALESIASASGVDLLHIKGPSADASLRPSGESSSTDADVLVRPSQIHRLTDALRRHGWREVIPVRSNAVLHHSTNWHHPELGQADIHLRFPGIQIEAEDAFDVLTKDHGTTQIAHCPCRVPTLDVQRFILLLHAARSPQSHERDIELSWGRASNHHRAAVQDLSRRLDAEVALAAATGNLEEFSNRREYALWSMYSDGTSTQAGFRKLWAEVRAAPRAGRYAVLAGLSKLWNSLFHMPRRLSDQTGQPVSAREVADGYLNLARRAGRDLKEWATRERRRNG